MQEMPEMVGQSLGQEDSGGRNGNALSSILAWRIPWPEEPHGQQFMGLQRVGQDQVTKHSTAIECKKK